MAFKVRMGVRSWTNMTKQPKQLGMISLRITHLGYLRQEQMEEQPTYLCARAGSYISMVSIGS